MLIKAVAVYAHGFPLEVVEEATHVKSETVSRFLKRVCRLALWGELEGRILDMKPERKVPGVKPEVVSKRQMDWLHDVIEAELQAKGELRFLGRVKAGEYRKRRKRNQQKIARILRAVVTDPKEAQRDANPIPAKSTGLQNMVINGNEMPESLMRKLFGTSNLRNIEKLKEH